MLIGIDVGTGSARAGVFDATGRLLGVGKHPVTMWQEPGEIVEQSSDQIWQAVCSAVHEALRISAINPATVTGIGFDATCSLVAVGPDGSGVPVGPSGDPARNVIVWMDHRAQAEAEEINAGGHDVLDYVGGRISPEMETPKLLWLARHMPDSFAKAAHFFDLSDYLTWRATGSLARSSCTLTCKWTYLAHESRWDAGYFHAIGLGALADEGFARIGTKVVAPATPVGRLTVPAATDLGLKAGTTVAAALIDAGLETVALVVQGPVVHPVGQARQAGVRHGHREGLARQGQRDRGELAGQLLGHPGHGDGGDGRVDRDPTSAAAGKHSQTPAFLWFGL